jgi:hypothetical protein
MTKRKKPILTDPSRRFTPDDIVQAIEGVEKAGLQISSVEITPAGSILITTGSRGAAASPSAAEASGMDETLPLKSKRPA